MIERWTETGIPESMPQKSSDKILLVLKVLKGDTKKQINLQVTVECRRVSSSGAKDK